MNGKRLAPALALCPSRLSALSFASILSITSISSISSIACNDSVQNADSLESFQYPLVPTAIAATSTCPVTLPAATLTPCGDTHNAGNAGNGSGSFCFDISLSVAPCTNSSSKKLLRIFSSVALAQAGSASATPTAGSPNRAIKNVLVAVHGLAYDAAAQVGYLQTALQAAGRLSQSAIISIQFLSSGVASGRSGYPPSANHFVWSSAAWRYGGRSNGDQNDAFRLLEMVLRQFFATPQFPELKNVIIAGHSAGGQFVQRYAAAHRDIRNLAAGVRFYYLVANPSSYVYLNHTRMACDRSGFSNPQANATWTSCATRRTSCIGNGRYDGYQYGINNLSASGSRFHYDKALPAASVIQQMRQRRVFYLLGTADIRGATNDCESNLQGVVAGSRLDRGRTYFQFMNRQYWPHNHHLVELNGIGHQARLAFNATETIRLLQRLLAN